jgi:hypothetical protein
MLILILMMMIMMRASMCRIVKDTGAATESFVSKNPALVTGFFFFAWYVLASHLFVTYIVFSSSMTASGRRYDESMTHLMKVRFSLLLDYSLNPSLIPLKKTRG